MQAATRHSPNFGLLGQYDAALVLVAARAEQYFPSNPVTALMKLRQYGELLAQQLAARTGVYGAAEEPKAVLLARLRREGAAPRNVLDLFHEFRRIGNSASRAHPAVRNAALFPQFSRREVLRRLRLATGGQEEGGGEHSKLVLPGGKRVAVPGHRDLARGTTRKILRDAAISMPLTRFMSASDDELRRTVTDTSNGEVTRPT